MIKLFTQKTCRPCMELKIFMRISGVEFTEAFIDEDDSAKSDFDKLGLMGTPAVVIGEQVYTGNNPETKEAILAYNG